jgi:hypothetical protein
MSSREKKALQEKEIKVGDTVRTAFRGGVREGWVGVSERADTSAAPPPLPPPPGTQMEVSHFRGWTENSFALLLLLQGGQGDH